MASVFLLNKHIEKIEQTIFCASLEFQQEIGTVVLKSHLICQTQAPLSLVYPAMDGCMWNFKAKFGIN